ncbi:MAG: hypothetical protein LBC26_07660, partial [Oscillospiraceae bacterium]|nr:hypothetical protein [Oscillospiraceae bacterium]
MCAYAWMGGSIKRFLCIGIAVAILLTCAMPGVFSIEEGTAAAAMSGRTNFITDRYDFDDVLQRPYNDDVPLGFSENIFALHSPGWGFSRIYRTGLTTEYQMNVTLTAGGPALLPTGTGVYRPSYVTQTRPAGREAEPDPRISVRDGEYPKPSASFTGYWGYLNSLNDGNTNQSQRWTNYVDTRYDTGETGP